MGYAGSILSLVETSNVVRICQGLNEDIKHNNKEESNKDTDTASEVHLNNAGKGDC